MEHLDISFVQSLLKMFLKKCNITAVDLRYVTLPADTKLYSFSDYWEQETTTHIYSTRLDDPLLLPMRDKTKSADHGNDDTCCTRMFVTRQPIRVLSVQQGSMLELCKKWVSEHYGQGSGQTTGDSATNGDDSTHKDKAADMPSAHPRNIFVRKSGISLMDYALYREHITDFHSIRGVAYEEAPPPPNPTRHILLFSTEALVLQQEFVYPAKKKLRKDENGFMCCNEPSRPQAPPMKRGKSVNTPPLPSHSPGGKPLNTHPLPSHSPGGPPLPPPYASKTPPPQPTPRPSTPTMADDKGDGKGPSKPPLAPRESITNKVTTLPKDAALNENPVKEDESNTTL